MGFGMGRMVCPLNIRNPRPEWPAAALFDKRVDRRRFAADHCLHPILAEVAHPTRHAKPRRFLHHPVPIADALHAAKYQQPFRLHAAASAMKWPAVAISRATCARRATDSASSHHSDSWNNSSTTEIKCASAALAAPCATARPSTRLP